MWLPITLFITSVAFHCIGQTIAIQKFKTDKIVPDVIDKVPTETLQVDYGNDVRANLGNLLKPSEVKHKPVVAWNGDPHSRYVVLMIDPDAPSRANATNREWQHWLVTNIPGNRMAQGEVISDYIGAGPPKGTGRHRYVFLVFKQPKLLIFDEPRSSSTEASHRPKFTTRAFIKKYDLEGPIAGNYFQAEWDDSVPELQTKLKG